jgi:signal peptidase II
MIPTSPDESTRKKAIVLPPDTALFQAASHLRFWFCAVVGLVLDLWSKMWVFDNLKSHEARSMLPGAISFMRSLNEGALFGLGRGWRWLFVGASVLAFGFVLYLFSQSSRRRWSLHLALGMILAGAMGNLYDRALYGQVRDFIKFDFKVAGYDVWPWVFNFADVLLVVGVGILLLNLWLDKRAAEGGQAAQAEADNRG